MNKVLWIIELFPEGISPIGAPDETTIFPERGWLAVNSWKKNIRRAQILYDPDLFFVWGLWVVLLRRYSSNVFKCSYVTKTLPVWPFFEGPVPLQILQCSPDKVVCKWCEAPHLFDFLHHCPWRVLSGCCCGLELQCFNRAKKIRSGSKDVYRWTTVRDVRVTKRCLTKQRCIDKPGVQSQRTSWNFIIFGGVGGSVDVYGSWEVVFFLSANRCFFMAGVGYIARAMCIFVCCHVEGVHRQQVLHADFVTSKRYLLQLPLLIRNELVNQCKPSLHASMKQRKLEFRPKKPWPCIY